MEHHAEAAPSTIDTPVRTIDTPARDIGEITAAPMPAHRLEWENRLLDGDALQKIATEVDGPFHVMYPARIIENIQAFRTVFSNSGLTGSIYYGKKANKSPCVIAACLAAGAGVDVASVGELKSARAGGIAGADLMVTGPAKSDQLLALAARENAVIAIDTAAELGRLATIDRSARIVLRVLPDGSSSRFGMTETELDDAVRLAARASIRLEGFSFHLSGYNAAARADQAAKLIEKCVAARDLGHPAATISIGGGFGVDYVPEDAWKTFCAQANPMWFHGCREPKVDSYYPYHFPVPGPGMLAAVLRHGNLTEKLRAAGIRLAVEPGRALLDGAGSTVFRIQGVKTRIAHGQPYDILTVNGSSLSLSEQWFDSEYLPDPVLWPKRPGDVTPTCVGGSTCLEEDMLSWRRIPFPRPATTEDLLIYPNTAGYQMDSNESPFHELPIPPKVVLRSSPDGRQFDWNLDTDDFTI
ncbi:alanine racemase [Nocardia tengchongensis]|uniref:alanine racemase n=1 Tax=Nocardia tengchongensis TaxID=2055889 RepID=UPI0036551822